MRPCARGIALRIGLTEFLYTGRSSGRPGIGVQYPDSRLRSDATKIRFDCSNRSVPPKPVLIMAYLRALGSYLPARIVDNAELAALIGADPEWIWNATGIEQRRFAAPEESVASLGVLAAKDCLESVGVSAGE